MSVQVTACSPAGTPACSGRGEGGTPESRVSAAKTFTEPQALARTIGMIESLSPVPAGERFLCPEEPVGQPEVKLQFWESPQAEPFAKAVGTWDGCEFL